MKKTSLKQKIGLIFFGVFICVLFLEIVLQLSGFIALSIKDINNRKAIFQKGTYKILCVGDSMTASGGEGSYPSQLQEILNDKNLGFKFTVINEGIPGSTSNAVAARLGQIIDKYTPDMVIVMMGINDDFLKAVEEITEQNIFIRFIRKSKLYKLSILIRKHLEAKIREFVEIKAKKEIQKNVVTYEKNKASLIDDQELFALAMKKKDLGNFEETLELLSSLQGKQPNNEIINFELAQAQYHLNKPYAAIESLNRVLEINNKNAPAHLYLGAILVNLGQCQTAITLIEKGLALDPLDPWGYNLLVTCFEMQGEYDKAIDVCLRALEHLPKVQWFNKKIASLRNRAGQASDIRNISTVEEEAKYYSSTLVSKNYKKVVDIARKKKVKLVCVQYPMRSVKPLKWALRSAEDVIIVDNETVFKEAVANSSFDEYFFDSFGGDFGHCTEKGNKILAQNISAKILKEVFKSLK